MTELALAQLLNKARRRKLSMQEETYLSTVAGLCSKIYAAMRKRERVLINRQMKKKAR